MVVALALVTGRWWFIGTVSSRSDPAFCRPSRIQTTFGQLGVFYSYILLQLSCIAHETACHSTQGRSHNSPCAFHRAEQPQQQPPTTSFAWVALAALLSGCLAVWLPLSGCLCLAWLPGFQFRVVWQPLWLAVFVALGLGCAGRGWDGMGSPLFFEGCNELRCLFFTRVFHFVIRCTAHCNVQCVSANLANRASHISFNRLFFAALRSRL